MHDRMRSTSPDMGSSEKLMLQAWMSLGDDIAASRKSGPHARSASGNPMGRAGRDEPPA